MLWRSVVEACCSGMLGRSVGEECREVVEKSVAEKIGEECWRRVLWSSRGLLEESVVEKCWGCV